MIRGNPYVTLQLTDKLQLTGNFGFYWRESKQDGVYGLGGLNNLIRAPGGSNARYIGAQSELILEYQANRYLSMEAAYSFFSAGDFIRQTGPHGPIHFIGMEVL